MGGTVAIVQARMTSTRLPGKVLRDVGGRPLLHYQLERLRQAASLDRIVVATTTNATDDVVVQFCTAAGFEVTRGPEHDVLERFALAVHRFAPDVVVRLTSDCPLLPGPLVDEAVRAFLAQGCDYLSNMLEPTYPYGLAVEAMRADALRTAAAEAVDPQEREHVTPFIYWRPRRFRLGSNWSRAFWESCTGAIQALRSATSWRCWSGIQSG
jgi:spore coat polysaccharide biosynthesis protein SpsF